VKSSGSTKPLPVKASDLQGASRLGADAVVGIADVVEAMHRAILLRVGVPGAAAAGEGRTAGITGMVYRAVRGVARLSGGALDAVFGQLAGSLDDVPPSPAREAVIAALNGVWGDHLADTGNPLAIPMAFRVEGRALDLAGPSPAWPPGAGRRLAVLVHGLCMNDLQWAQGGADHAAQLARECGFTPIHLHYNSGRHVSQNGREFSGLLEGLVAGWPLPVEELVIVGHSMGGLVARSACHYATVDGLAWPGRLKSLVCLGTPHHGAPLERGGHWLETMFALSPFVAPFARLSRARSAGITDLRFGNLRDEDWQAGRRHTQRHDDRLPTPLPPGLPVFLVAATQAERLGGLHDRVLGDGLVPIDSALGRHAEPTLDLGVPAARCRVVVSATHWDLLSCDQTLASIRDALAASRGPVAPDA
jgi:pimeloyl-ACP methyl ester carboxylesterase